FEALWARTHQTGPPSDALSAQKSAHRGHRRGLTAEPSLKGKGTTSRRRDLRPSIKRKRQQDKDLRWSGKRDSSQRPSAWEAVRAGIRQHPSASEGVCLPGLRRLRGCRTSAVVRLRSFAWLRPAVRTVILPEVGRES